MNWTASSVDTSRRGLVSIYVSTTNLIWLKERTMIGYKWKVKITGMRTRVFKYLWNAIKFIKQQLSRGFDAFVTSPSGHMRHIFAAK